MISTEAAYSSGMLTDAAGQPVYPDQGIVGGPEAGMARYILPAQPPPGMFTPAATRQPVIPAQAPVMIDSTMPQGTPISMPSIVQTATTYLPPQQSALQPSDLLHPLPSIVNTEPVVVQSPCANTIEQWVSDNPLLALLGLGVLGYFVLGRKGK